jgi:iron complex outermembrane receptor protein
VVLETAEGEVVTPTTEVVGDALIAEIPNAVLALPDDEVFEQFNPAPGIGLVRVTSLPGERVQVSITGTEAPPTAQVRTEAGNLVLSVVPGVMPEEAEEVEEIELIVTATRTAEEEEDIPRSVTVITREQIEEQNNLTTNLQDILGQTVPGLEPPTFSTDFTPQLRGRDPQVLINGVPISSNQDVGFSPLTSIAPSAIERVEVVRGPSAAFGDGATGGAINIITRRPSEDELVSTAEVRVTSRGDLVAESFGNYLEYGLSGTSGAVDYVFNFSTEEFGFVFDGEGDQIPRIGFGDENGRSFNVLGQLGVDLSENQRLQLSVNHFDVSNEIEFINDPTVDDDPDADKARVLERDIEFIDLPDGDTRQFTNISLNYNHDDIFGSQLRLQGFYRDNSDHFGQPFQDTFTPEGLTAGRFLTGGSDSERFGGRLEVETAFSETFNLLWGADYSNEEASTDRQLLDDEFITSGFRVARLDEEFFFAPPHTIETLGLFAQAQWDVTPRWLLSGGVRYENIGLSVDDYTVRLFQPEPFDIEGGNINADDVVFNIGTVYDLTDELSVFASFAQGFGVPQFGRLLRFPPDEFRSLEEDLEFTAPQIVNNYELGIRGQWDNVQFSLAGFFNRSDLGSTFRDGILIRAPERIYGVEATADWQPSETWRLGSSISWSEGENDVDDDGDFEPLRSIEISPIKVTAYVENETLPGWRNRFQALFVGGRDRAFEAGVEDVEIKSYFVLDYISSIDLGPGSLQIGIRNLLDNEFFVPTVQGRTDFSQTNRIAAPGRTISIGYRVTF